MKKIIAALMMVAGIARAGDRDSLSVRILGNSPTSKIQAFGSDKNGGVGYGVGAEYVHRLYDHLGLGAELTYATRSKVDSSVLLPGALTTVSGSDLTLMAIGKFFVNKAEEKLQPYLSLGLGFGRSRAKGVATPNPGFVWAATGTNDTRTVVDSSKTSWAMSIRGGLDTFVNDSKSVSVGAEVGWFKIGNMTYPLTASGAQVLPGVSGVSVGQVSGIQFGGRTSYHF
jgi:hypothetical protein